MNRSSSLLFYKLVATAIFAGVIACLVELSDVYHSPTAAPAQPLTAATPLTPHTARTS